MGVFDALEPDDYDGKGSIASDRSVVVFDEDRRKGIVEVSYSWDDLNYHLALSEEYSDSAHLDALGFMAEKYEDEELPDDLTTEDVASVSAATSSGIDVNWKDEIAVGYPGSELGY
ncbi:MAG: hypothetical protein ABEJ87_02445 [Candidatus Nanohalobium sp.]